MLLTNELQQTSVRYQKSANDSSSNHCVKWDYHVIFLVRNGSDVRVYDQDTRLEWGAPFREYYDKALKTEPNEINTLFRVVPSKVYLDNFASDRSHMLRMVKGLIRYSAPPPDYAPIKNSKG